MADSDQPEPTGSGEGPDPGTTLREAREAKGASVEDISTELRIEPHLLRALEAGDYAALGAPVFAKGYIRQYSSRLGLDSVALVDRYTAATGATDVHIAPARAIRLRDSRQLTSWIIAALVLALIAALLLVWWLRQPDTPPAERSSVTGSEASLVPEPVALPAAVAARPVDGNAPSARTGGTLAVSGIDADGSAAPASAPSGRSGVSAGAESEGATSGAAVASGAAAGASPGGEAPAGSVPDAPRSERGFDVPSPAVASTAANVTGGGLNVQIEFTDECWAEITDADGRRIFYGLAEAGDRRTLRGTPPLDVFLGNADAAEILVNGQEFTVPGAARRGNLARFSIDSRND